MFENESMTSKVGQGFVLPPAGNHLARLCAIIALGTSDNEYPNKAGGGKPVIKHEKRIRLGFELIETSHVFDIEKGPEPFVAWVEYTDVLGTTSNLGKMMKAWIWAEKEVSKEEMEAFNFVSLLGKKEFEGGRCMVNVTHGKSKKGNDKYDISGITPVPKSIKVPAGKVSQVLFNFNLPFKAEVFKGLQKFVQDKIRTSDEYKKIVGSVDTGGTPQKAGQIAAPNEEEDDLPF